MDVKEASGYSRFKYTKVPFPRARYCFAEIRKQHTRGSKRVSAFLCYVGENTGRIGRRNKAFSLNYVSIFDSGMANAADSGSLECAICLQNCVYPVQLPCKHIFCFLCVKVRYTSMGRGAGVEGIVQKSNY